MNKAVFLPLQFLLEDLEEIIEARIAAAHCQFLSDHYLIRFITVCLGYIYTQFHKNQPSFCCSYHHYLELIQRQD